MRRLSSGCCWSASSAAGQAGPVPSDGDAVVPGRGPCRRHRAGRLKDFLGLEQGGVWSPLETERILLAAARVGQQVFAQQVLANCGSRCVFCGCSPRPSAPRGCCWPGTSKLAGGQGCTPGPETSAVLRMAVPLCTRPAAGPAERARMSCWPIRVYVFGSSTSWSISPHAAWGRVIWKPIPRRPAASTAS
jgi:hypothetical protein